MVRNLYRSYLYAVCIILLISATIATGVSLGLLLLAAPALRGPYDQVPDRSQVVQSVVAFVVVWLVTLTLGGLHYWLIRRDMATDPAAAGGAVRSFFLNVTQMLVALIAVGESAAAISNLGDPNNSSASLFAAALATVGLFVVLQWERGRTRVATDGARALQRLHLFGAQLILVFIATPLWFRAAQTSVQYVFIVNGNLNPCDYYYLGPTCAPGTSLPIGLLVTQWIAALFVAACWAGYTAFSRADRHSRLRQVTHLLALAFGLGLLVQGAQGILDALLRAIVGHPFGSNELANGGSSATAAIVFGLVVLLAYRWLYRREAADLPSGQPAAGLSVQAVIAIVLAFPFWVGLDRLMSDVVERVVPAGSHPLASDFAQAGALLLTGLPFVAFTLLLGARTRQTGVSWPHRVFVLVMLASGTIATATGLIITLQALGSTLLGAPPDNWQQTARSGVVALLVGGAMVAIFLTLGVRHRYLAGRAESKPMPEPGAAPASAPPVTAQTQPAVSGDSLEGILDALVAGRLTRDEAAARIRQREGTH